MQLVSLQQFLPCSHKKWQSLLFFVKNDPKCCPIDVKHDGILTLEELGKERRKRRFLMTLWRPEWNWCLMYQRLPCLPWQNKLKFWSATVKFCFLNQNWRFLLTIWKLSNYSYSFDFTANFMLKNENREEIIKDWCS